MKPLRRVGPARADRGSGRARCRRRPAGRRPSRPWPCVPSSVPRATASRSRSPEDTCGTPYLACRRCACVPLPEPGAPSNTIRIMSIPTLPKKRRYPTENERRARDTRLAAALRILRARDPGPAEQVSTPMPAKKPPSPATPSTPSPAASPPSSTPPPAASSRPRASTSNRIGKVYAGRNGIIGALTEDLIDTSKESAAAIRALRHTPVRRVRLGALQAEEVRGQPGASTSA